MNSSSLPASTHIGRVSLTVTDLDRAVKFYHQVLGFKVIFQKGDQAALGVSMDQPLLLLNGSPLARRERGTTGLYHFAIKVPTREDLAWSIRRIVDQKAGIEGASDHGVSEAIYLSDPDLNGIEIYSDRPKSRWPMDTNGRIEMVTDPLDLKGLMATISEGIPTPEFMDPETRIGHVHLHVSNLKDAFAFYVETLGFDLIQYYGESALFVSAGGYHHHIGLNTWAGVGAPPPSLDAVGLLYYSIVIPEKSVRDQVVEKVKSAGYTIQEDTDGTFITDPSQNRILLPENGSEIST